MHDSAKIRIVGQQVMNNFTEGFREKSFVKAFDSLVNIFFAGGYSAFGIAIGIQGSIISVTTECKCANFSHEFAHKMIRLIFRDTYFKLLTYCCQSGILVCH